MALTQKISGGKGWPMKNRHSLPIGAAIWTPASTEPSSHPNSRFSPAKYCPINRSKWEDPAGVPISAILFGGRRGQSGSSCFRAFDWNHGTFLGSTVSSETLPLLSGCCWSDPEENPFAILPFCGYNMGDYFKHWIETGAKTRQSKLPKIFYVNWFRKTEETVSLFRDTEITSAFSVDIQSTWWCRYCGWKPQKDFYQNRVQLIPMD